jgi:hypothetical protein
MEFDLSTPERVAALIINQDGWTDDELTNLIEQYKTHCFIEDSKWFLKFSKKGHKRMRHVRKQRIWRDFTGELDHFNDTISILKLQAQHA